MKSLIPSIRFGINDAKAFEVILNSITQDDCRKLKKR